ncbi:M14 family metallocarboxypeptidase [Bacillus sp. FJAT-47783]|uniref:M14 family metallopeptidase n=1 Tax=Bacillus sp. FJAT-47783 TaxID=2922712 RepID=UPI001FAB6F52|nr:M14 family metallocarboxypeptidase [Bacillus sp. FJAT-47783]
MEIYLTEDTTVENVAKHFKLTKKILYAANPTLNGDDLERGNVLHIPGWYKKETKALDAHSQNVKFDYPDDLKFAMNITMPTIETKKNYDFFLMEKDIETLLKNFPFIKKRVIGESVLGLPIYELIIGNGNLSVHMNGAFHANEWITSAVMMKWLDDYARAIVMNGDFNGISVRELYEKTTLSFVPMVNPDGVNLVLNKEQITEDVLTFVQSLNQEKDDFSNWKANIRGVDLNNQYPAYWEIEKERKIPKSPAPSDFPGNFPLTEPEAIAMANLVQKSNFDRIVAFHTQGEEIYWGYLNCEPKLAAKIVREFKRLSGYKAVRNIDSHAGFRDWYIYKYKRPGFTVELGRGVNPLPISQFDEIYEKCRGIFWAILYM